MAEKTKLVAVVGPTAVGKTALAIALAKRLGAEVVSGDSMLVYRGMDVGTAKPGPAEMDGVPHHLIDILDPREPFSVTQFKARAEAAVAAIAARGRLPILAGGTGLYLRSLLEDYRFNRTPGDDAYRAQIERLAAERGKAHVHALLAEVDPEAAARLHVNDFRRVVRALEVHHLSGERISQQHAGELVYDAFVVGLTMERAALYARIERRVDQMLAAGLVEEVRALRDAGVPDEAQAMQAIGYKEIAAALRGELSLEEAAAEIKKATRHFAKRQLTWFRKMPYICWYQSDRKTMEEIMEDIYKELEGKVSFL